MFVYSIYHLGSIGETFLGPINKVRLKNWQPDISYTPSSRSAQKRMDGQVFAVVEGVTGDGDGKVRQSNRGGIPMILIHINRVSGTLVKVLIFKSSHLQL